MDLFIFLFPGWAEPPLEMDGSTRQFFNREIGRFNNN